MGRRALFILVLGFLSTRCGDDEPLFPIADAGVDSGEAATDAARPESRGRVDATSDSRSDTAVDRPAKTTDAADGATSDGPMHDDGVRPDVVDAAFDAGTDVSVRDVASPPYPVPDAAFAREAAPAQPTDFRPALLSNVDKMPGVVLTPDRLGMELRTLAREGVRSDTAIDPGTGIYYFEGERLVDEPWMIVGVATLAAPLDGSPNDTGQGLDVDTGDGSWFDSKATSRYGFIVDYRLSHPTVHVIGVGYWGGARIVYSSTLARISAPLYIFVGGLRRNVGPQMRINTGNDTTNFPFFYDPVAMMNDAHLADAGQLVRGWGGSHAAPRDEAPVLTMSKDVSAPYGSPVTLTATARDFEEGDLTSKIEWGDLATPRGARVSGRGGSFTFTPDAIGVHEVEAAITDAAGKTTRASVEVTVMGTLPTYLPVQLVPDAQSAGGVILTPNGLGAHFTASAKIGIRANQGLYRGFQYFEIHREVGPVNVGGGIVTKDGNLDPYGPWDVPPSCSVNMEGGAWRELMFDVDFTTKLKNQNTETYFGFAVDYRGTSPIVYVVAGGIVVDVIAVTNATVPVYPMLYGYPVSSGTAADETINFGATPFHYDPKAALSSLGVDVRTLQVGWGPYGH
ncbi:MAG TPA: hypothetical protein VJT73_13855 [Polyangiaceae bacterium]|nr:hypothetical protein [Polyangiaceae bacterium]